MKITKDLWKEIYELAQLNADLTIKELHALVHNTILEPAGMKISFQGLLTNLNRNGIYLNGQLPIKQEKEKVRRKQEIVERKTKFTHLDKRGREKWNEETVLEAFVRSGLSTERFSKQSESIIGKHIKFSRLTTMIKANIRYMKALTNERLRRLGVEVGLELEHELSNNINIQSILRESKEKTIEQLVTKLDGLMSEFTVTDPSDTSKSIPLKKDIEFCLSMIKKMKNLNMVDEIKNIRNNFLVDFQINLENLEENERGMLTDNQLNDDKVFIQQFKDAMKKLVINPELEEMAGKVIDYDPNKEEDNE